MLLNDSITADFRHLLKGKILEDLTSRHTGGGGDWMFSLKTQEEREEDRTGRMGGGGAGITVLADMWDIKNTMGLLPSRNPQSRGMLRECQMPTNVSSS